MHKKSYSEELGCYFLFKKIKNKNMKCLQEIIQKCIGRNNFSYLYFNLQNNLYVALNSMLVFHDK